MARGRNLPCPGVPRKAPLLTMTLPREMVVTGIPTTSHPSYGLYYLHVQGLGRHAEPRRGVDEHDVRVAPGRDDALSRVEPEDAGRVGRGHLDQPGDRQPTLDDALREEERDPRLDVDAAGRRPVERFRAGPLVLHVDGVVVRGDC